MSKQISVALRDSLFRRAEILAERLGREVADVLADAIEASLDPLGLAETDDSVPTAWSDEQVLAAADAFLTPAEDQRLADLQDQQQAGRLSSAEAAELTGLMQTYQEGLLRKALGLREAVRRGLRQVPVP